MTKSEMITVLSTMVGNEEEIVLSSYLDLAAEAILNRLYPYASGNEELSVPRKYHALQIEAAAYMLNKRGAEGQVSHSENGISRSFGSADLPNEMLSRIVPYVGVIG